MQSSERLDSLRRKSGIISNPNRYVFLRHIAKLDSVRAFTLADSRIAHLECAPTDAGTKTYIADAIVRIR